MGWNSWNAFRTEVNEEKVLGAARALVDTGLAKLGYRYVNIDDGWWLKRRQSDGRILIRTAIFPSARTGGKQDSSFRPFVDRIHAMGLKAGIYTDVGRNACSQAFDLHSPNLPEGTTAEREIGLYGHVDQDIRLFFAEWGFDYVKADACGLADFRPGTDLVAKNGYRPMPPRIERGMPNRTDHAQVRALYQDVADALARHNPDGDYVFSIVPWGEANVRSWGKDVGNLWRTSNDITPEWTRMLHTFDSAATRALYAQPHSWNDPDMLFIGAGDFDENHLVEARSHFSLWAIANAPLLIGYDLRNAPRALLDIWGNADVVAVNQDPAGNQGVIAYQSDDVQIIVKTMQDTGRKAVVLFNRGQRTLNATLTAEHLKFAAGQPFTLTDLWSKARFDASAGEQSFALAPRETRMFMASGTRALPDGVYLSEIPGSVNVAHDGVLRPEADPTIHQMVSPWGGTRSSGERAGYPGWGGAQADAAPYGTALQVAGRKFSTGLGLLGGSRLEVRNDKGDTRFSALVGIDDATRDPAARVRFTVYGDGRLLAQSPELAFGAAPAALTADVTGVRIVELVAREDGGDAPIPTSVCWCEAALTGR
ncbi:alpha-galactosidase [Sphingomonas parva]|uniref:Alpha-galactosidase n=2 Tax=Sphingomonas parva TaxID=2555898 RepID=A0A4Y8ZLS7_9SPHN|nr:alpha-galactosidase [Sphingomonas parva]